MTPFGHVDMAEATRLTREGRLEEAMAVLRGAPAATPDGGGPARPRPAGRILDLMPPAATGEAWTMPEAPPAPRARGGAPTFGDLGAALGGVAARGRRPAVPVPPGARFEERVHAGPAGQRSYKLFVPSGRAGQRLPLVVMLHGCTQSPDDFALGTRMNEVAEEEGVLVAYPEQTRAANAQRCWNWFSAADQRRGEGEPALIAGITREVLRDEGADPARVFVAGLSAGGAAAAVMGAAYPDLFAAVGVHSGLACGAAADVAGAFAAMRQGGGAALPRGSRGAVPTIAFHGDRDGTVSPVNGEEVIAQARGGARLTTEVARGRSAGGQDFTRTVHRDGEGRARFEHWLLHGAGHAWSGGSAEGSHTDPRGPDASREMLRFFRENARAGRG